MTTEQILHHIHTDLDAQAEESAQEWYELLSQTIQQNCRSVASRFLDDHAPVRNGSYDRDSHDGCDICAEQREAWAGVLEPALISLAFKHFAKRLIDGGAGWMDVAMTNLREREGT